MTTTVTTSDGIKLAVRSTGNGQPLVFVHEFSGTARSWDAQFGHFSRHYQCITYCARGYPPSDVPPAIAAYSQERAADDLADIIRAMAKGPAHVVGLSMGGFAALHLGLRNPDLIKTLTIAGVGYGANPEQQPAYGNSMRAEADHAEALGIAAFARELADSPYAQCLRAKDGDGWRHFSLLLSQNSAIGMAMTLRGILAARPSLWHLVEPLRNLKMPILLMIGDEDAPCIEPNIFLKSVLPDAALCVLPRTGHLLNLEEPALFNGIIFTFLNAAERGQWKAWSGRT
jgi:pimeloyl-ACP methyl ester carboxylesterase